MTYNFASQPRRLICASQLLCLASVLTCCQGTENSDVTPMNARMKRADLARALAEMPAPHEINNDLRRKRAIFIAREFQKVPLSELSKEYKAFLDRSSDPFDYVQRKNKLCTLTRFVFNVHGSNLWPLIGPDPILGTKATDDYVFRENPPDDASELSRFGLRNLESDCGFK